MAMQPTHNLYQFTFSIASIMVRYAFALRADAVDPDHEICLEERHIDMKGGKEPYTEHFLCDINPDAEVPVLEGIGRSPQPPLPGCVAITTFLAKSYPSMIPESHKEEVTQLLHDLHGINFFGLSHAGRMKSVLVHTQYIDSLLKGQISERYRAALIHRRKGLESTKMAALTPQAQRANEEYTANLMTELESLLKESKTGYMFGFPQPSALDAHLVALIARMLEIGRDDLIPASLQSYGEKAMGGGQWNQVMRGRSTNNV